MSCWQCRNQSRRGGASTGACSESMMFYNIRWSKGLELTRRSDQSVAAAWCSNRHSLGIRIFHLRRSASAAKEDPFLRLFALLKCIRVYVWVRSGESSSQLGAFFRGDVYVRCLRLGSVSELLLFIFLRVKSFIHFCQCDVTMFRALDNECATMNNEALSEKVACDMHGVLRRLTSTGNLRNGRRRKFRRPFRESRCLTRA